MTSGIAEFLQTVITTPEGYLELGVRNGTWQQHWYEWPTDLSTVVQLAGSSQGDVYFSAHLFKAKDSHKSQVLPSRTIQADLDNADTSNLPLMPTVLVSTSPQRHQGFWIASQEFDSLDSQEHLSKKLTYSIPLCDRSGWSLGHKVRVPFTQNYKYKDGPYPVRLLKQTTKLYKIDELELLPDIPVSNIPNGTFIDSPPDSSSMPVTGTYELVESIKDQLSAKVYAEYMQAGPSSDRSISLFSLTTQCFRAGLSREQVYWIAYHSPNNKFHSDLRFNADRELAKDVIRAEHAVKSQSVNMREIINDIRRRSKTLSAERRRAIYEIVLKAMQLEGDFIHLLDDRRYYVPDDTGRPLEIEHNSEDLRNLLDIKYTLNRTEPEHMYTVGSLVSYSGTVPETAQAAVLSYYDQASNHVLIHGGRKDVHVITGASSDTQRVSNGTYNVLFPWDRIIEPFTPIYDPTLDWAAVLFDLPNVINMTPEEARCALKVWVIFSLLREAASTRPILAFLGQPGCLSGRTLVKIRIGKHFKEYTLEEIYKKFNNIPVGGRGNWRTWRKDIPTEVLSMKDGSIKYKAIKDIVSSGVKQTYYVGIDNGRTIYATEDHLFLTPTGYVPLSKLQIGDTVLVRSEAAKPITDYKYKPPTRKRVRVNFHPYGSNETVDGKLYPRIYYSKAVVEAKLNNLSVEDYLYILQTSERRAKLLNYLPLGIDIHHIDGDVSNNSLDNLELLTHAGHAKQHSIEENTEDRFGYFTPEEAKIKQIFPWRKEPTYDITMEDTEAPNFLANDFIVHNSGKTSTAKKLYAFFYGRHMDVSGATSPVNYDIATASLPFYVLDNLDTWEKWIPDRLAQSAGKTDVIVRKLYTNNQMIRIKRQAMVAVTAHDPKFGRADVTDRMLIVSLQRFSNMSIKFEDEGALLNSVISSRNRLWGGVLHDLQLTLSTPFPQHPSLQMRIQDFARLGEWISIAIGQQALFSSAVDSLQAAQRTFNLDEDHILVTSLQRWITRRTSNAPRTQDELFSEVSSLVPAEDIRTFQALYKNSSVFTKRISNLQDTLNSTTFKIEIALRKGGERMWTIEQGHQANDR